MKRLLPLLALTLVGCSFDQFSATSEVGEKMIVKKETIRLSYQSNDLDDRQATDRHLAWLKQVDCWESEIECEQRKEAWTYREKLSHGPVWHKNFRYVPIFIDLNGQKSVGKEHKATCTDRKIVEAAPLAFTNTFTWTLDPNGGTTVKDKIDRMICKEYANF